MIATNNKLKETLGASDIQSFLRKLQIHREEEGTFVDQGTPFVFAESLSVKKYEQDNKRDVSSSLGELKNILAEGQFLLPAGCVVRPGNTTLKRFIDYHLMKSNKGKFQLEIDKLIHPDQYSECLTCRNITQTACST